MAASVEGAHPSKPMLATLFFASGHPYFGEVLLPGAYISDLTFFDLKIHVQEELCHYHPKAGCSDFAEECTPCTHNHAGRSHLMSINLPDHQRTPPTIVLNQQ